MPSISSVHIIFNPNSTGSAKDQAAGLQAGLRKQRPELPVTLLPTEYAGHATQLAYQTAIGAPAGKPPLIVSASGDGGYNEVINGALRAQAAGASPVCAVLPSGNANDHARTTQQRPLLDAIVDGTVTKLDILQVTTKTPDGSTADVRYAHSYVGLGLTPAVAVELNKHTLNSFRESLIVLRTFWNLRPVTIRTAKGTLQHLDCLICSTIPEMAKVLTLSEDAAPDDGKFELLTLRHNHKLRLLYSMLRGVFRSLEASSREHDYICTVLRPTPIQLDGEVMKLKANTKLEISLQPGLLQTIN